MLTFYHDSRKPEMRTPFGALPVGTGVTLSVISFEDSLESPARVRDATLFCRFYGTRNEYQTDSFSPIEWELPLNRIEESTAETEHGTRLRTVYSLSLPLPECGVLFYAFHFRTEEEDRDYNLFYGPKDGLTGGAGRTVEDHCDSFYQITVYPKTGKIPSWFRNGIIYQIFPDRFARGFDAMAEDKKESFYYSSWDDTPYYVKDPDGSVARWDFHRGNLSGINEKIPYLEGLGADILYLNPIFSAASNHRYDTADYLHVDGLLGGDPAFDLLAFICKKEGIRLILDGVFSHTGARSIYFDKDRRYGNGAYGNPSSPYYSWYEFTEEEPCGYRCWWGVSDLPNVNELDPGYMDFTVKSENSVVRSWIRRGASGWRLDVADELPDRFIQELRKACDETGEEEGMTPVILGEVWEDATNKVSYDKMRSYFTAKELTTVTNYPFRKNLLDFFRKTASGSEISERFLCMQENYPPENFNVLVNMTGTHDVKRLMTEMLEISGGDTYLAKKLVRAYAAVTFTFPGVPLVYYGDETCLEGGEDPDNRRTYPWGKEDKAMIRYFSQLAALRKSESVFTRGDTVFLTGGNDWFGFRRTAAGADVLVLVSNSPDEICSVTVPGISGASYEYLVSGGASEGEALAAGPDGLLHAEVEGGVLVLGAFKEA